MTERLWLTQPRRATAIAKVTAAAGDLFTLDRSLFAPTSKACRHPQPHDMGMVWIDGGEKRKLVRVVDRGGEVWHQLRGTVPPVGATLNCQLDQERRELESRAHTAMHLLLVALQRAGAGPMVADPTVKGGGTFRLDFAQPVAPRLLAGALAQANQWVLDNRTVRVEHVLREMQAKVLDAQLFEVPDPYPGPPGSVPAARVEGAGCLPCDGTHVERTAKVGRVVVPQAHRGPHGFVVVGRVVA